MKVTAIMPARGRQRLAGLAVVSFLAQTYEDKELIILDDEEEPAFPAGYQLGGSRKIHYIAYTGERQTIPEKRNYLCEQAPGELIMHFDSDDWSAPDRMADQVKRIQDSGLSVTGYHSMLFHHEARNAALKYKGYSPRYALGTTLAFRRSWWKDHPFNTITKLKDGTEQPLKIGEDNAFVFDARRANQILSVDAEKRMVARIHKENTCPKELTGCSFQPMSLTDLPEGFF